MSSPPPPHLESLVSPPPPPHTHTHTFKVASRTLYMYLFVQTRTAQGNSLRYSLHTPFFDSSGSFFEFIPFVLYFPNSYVDLYQLQGFIHHTSFCRCSPRGFSATCLQQIQGSVVEGLSQTATSGSQWVFLSETLSCALS